MRSPRTCWGQKIVRYLLPLPLAQSQTILSRGPIEVRWFPPEPWKSLLTLRLSFQKARIPHRSSSLEENRPAYVSYLTFSISDFFCPKIFERLICTFCPSLKAPSPLCLVQIKLQWLLRKLLSVHAIRRLMRSGKSQPFRWLDWLEVYWRTACRYLFLASLSKSWWRIKAV